MEFNIDVQELQYVVKLLALTAVRNTTDTKGRILIEAKDNKVLFLSNNGNVAIEYYSDTSEIKNEGITSIVLNNLYSFILPFQPWNGIFGSDRARIKTTKNALNIFIDYKFEDGSTSKNKLRLDLWDTAIARPDRFGNANIILNSHTMKIAITKVLYAIDPGEVRGPLQGMRVDFDEEHVNFVGTTGVMLSEYKIKTDTEVDSFTSKHDFMNVLSKALPADDTQLFIEVDDSKIRAKFGNVYIEGSQNIGHEYPKYKSALDSFTDTILLNKKAMSASLAPIQEILDQDDNCRITMHIKDKKMRIFSENTDFEYDGELDYDKEFIADLNGRLLKQTIDAIAGDDLVLRCSDEDSALIFDSAIHENQNSLLTPIKRRS